MDTVAQTPVARILLVRHGESVANTRLEVISGRSNHSPLSQRGREQAAALGAQLAACGYRPDAVYASPAVRAADTARLALESMGPGLPIHLDDRLQELDQGQWTGQPREQTYTKEQKAEIDRLGVYFAPPGGESMRDVGLRMNDWLQSVSSGNEAAQILAFTHGVAIRCLAGLIEDWPEERIWQTATGNTTLSGFLVTNGQASVGFLDQDAEAVGWL